MSISPLEAGDIAACYGQDRTSTLIRGLTASLFAPAGLRIGPSHVAILCEWNDAPLWVESTTLARAPCVIRGMSVAGVQAHRPEERIADYLHSGGHVDIYRLTPLNRLHKDERLLLTSLLLQTFVEPGVPYDLRGALFSGTRLLPWSRLFPRANFDHLFCSELVAAVVMRMNRMNHANPTRFHPARLLRQLVRTGKYALAHSLRGDS